MTAKKLLERNGDFSNSPLIDSLRRVNDLFEKYSAPYAVIGGLAVVRNGALRTTIDIDILTSKDDWDRIRQSNPKNFVTGIDHAVDKKNNIPIDVLFSGKEWDMVIPLMAAKNVREYDEELHAWFIDLLHLIELKTAVYLKKKKEDGIEIAAKDLADVVALIENNPGKVTDGFIDKINLVIRDEVRGIYLKVMNRSIR